MIKAASKKFYTKERATTEFFFQKDISQSL